MVRSPGMGMCPKEFGRRIVVACADDGARDWLISLRLALKSGIDVRRDEPHEGTG